MLSNNRMLNVLAGKSVDRAPVWIMRQAGRYLPEYRKVREQAGSFLNLCTNPILAAEVTLQPLKRFDLDAAIIFSDILTIPHAYDLGLEFLEKQGPCFSNPITCQKDIDSIPNININNNLSYVFEAIEKVKSKLEQNIALIGFAGSPWTVATYMVEGQSSKSFSKIKNMLYSTPAVLRCLLEKLTVDTIVYAIAQIKAGADIFMLFDTWGGVLSKPDFLDFSLYYMRKIVDGIKNVYPNVPIILFTKNGGKHLKDIQKTNCSAIGLDWTVSIVEARKELGNKITLQGNLDPTCLYASKDFITAKIESLMEEVGGNSRYIFNLGHGILPDVSPSMVEHLVKEVHKYSKLTYANKVKEE